MAVGSPWEFLDLADGQERAVTVLSAEIGRGTFTARGDLVAQTTDVLRLHLDPAGVLAGLPYVDVSSKTLIAQLSPLVLAAGYSPRRFTIRKVGTGLGARFSVASGPAQEVRRTA